jgi:hypothetical protein
MKEDLYVKIVLKQLKDKINTSTLNQSLINFRHFKYFLCYLKYHI